MRRIFVAENPDKMKEVPKPRGDADPPPVHPLLYSTAAVLRYWGRLVWVSGVILPSRICVHLSVLDVIAILPSSFGRLCGIYRNLSIYSQWSEKNKRNCVLNMKQLMQWCVRQVMPSAKANRGQNCQNWPCITSRICPVLTPTGLVEGITWRTHYCINCCFMFRTQFLFFFSDHQGPSDERE